MMITGPRVELIKRVHKHIQGDADAEPENVLRAEVLGLAVPAHQITALSQTVANSRDAAEREAFREWMRIQGQAQQGKPFTFAPQAAAITVGD